MNPASSWETAAPTSGKPAEHNHVSLVSGKDTVNAQLPVVLVWRRESVQSFRSHCMVGKDATPLRRKYTVTVKNASTPDTAWDTWRSEKLVKSFLLNSVHGGPVSCLTHTRTSGGTYSTITVPKTLSADQHTVPLLRSRRQRAHALLVLMPAILGDLSWTSARRCVSSVSHLPWSVASVSGVRATAFTCVRADGTLLLSPDAMESGSWKPATKTAHARPTSKRLSSSSKYSSHRGSEEGEWRVWNNSQAKDCQRLYYKEKITFEGNSQREGFLEQSVYENKQPCATANSTYKGQTTINLMDWECEIFCIVM